MTYSEKFEKWRRKAQEKAEQAKEKAKEIEEKYKIKDKLDEGLKAAEDVVKRGAETVGDAVTEAAQAGFEALSSTAQAAQDELGQMADEGFKDRLQEKVKWASEKAEDTVRSGAQAASEAFKSSSEAFKSSSEKVNAATSEFGEKARNYYQQAQNAYNFGQATTQAVGSMSTAVNQAAQWVRANPGKTAVIALSVTVGIRVGSQFPQLDVLLLGQKGHWFFRSAALAYGTRKLSEKYLAYLRQQQDLLAAGQLNTAERQRVEFQQQVALYVGAPLLGAFHIAAGIAILGEIFSPGHIVGFPIDLLLGQNPILETIWLFSNGLVCIHNGYEFITMAFADNTQVQKMVDDIKGLLPAATNTAAA